MILFILGTIEIVYGLLIRFYVVTPYAIKVSLKNSKSRKTWNMHHGTSKIFWGSSVIFLSLCQLHIGYSKLNLALAVVGLILALYASFNITS